MESIKHECGVAMIRLRKPLDYYRRKYGSYTYALDRLYLLMEKQHNRGQEAAGVGVVKLTTPPGHEYVYRERALGTGAIDDIFARIGKAVPNDVNSLPADEVEKYTPFIGEIYLGHLRYSTTGRSGIEYTHPFLRRNNWRSRTLLLCGNFNMTNAKDIFDAVVASGQHPRIYADTFLLLEQMGNMLDKENHRLYREYRQCMSDPDLARRIEAELDMARVLRNASPLWDGGYTICGTTGSGNSFVIRDPHGIRPAFYYVDDEIIVVASERPVIQTVFNVDIDNVKELTPGEALVINPAGDVCVTEILPQGKDARCSFERIYFSRGSDRDIYRERKALGANIVEDVLAALPDSLDNTVFSFIPNTAEVAHYGMVEELNRRLDESRKNKIVELSRSGHIDENEITAILKRKVRTEKVAIKDIKLRTFIAEGSSRNDLATHVYDITYGSLRPGKDTLVVIDDSIVRGTTLTRSILRILDRLGPKKIVVVSSSPQVRYPDFYGIDLPKLNELAAFRALIDLIDGDGKSELIDAAYKRAVEMVKLPPEQQKNVVQDLYALYSDKQLADRICRMLTPCDIKADTQIIYQSLDGLHQAIPNAPGDWYFSGDYPTPGGTNAVNLGFIEFYEKCRNIRYSH